MRILLLVHAAATLWMTGLIWFVQVVHYPLMARVGPDRFRVYEQDHTRLTTRVAAPPMILELVLAGLLALRPGASIPVAQTWTALALLTVIWLSTAFLQVPMHRRLSQGFDPAAHRRLVFTNWIRTAAWSARTVLALSWLA